MAYSLSCSIFDLTLPYKIQSMTPKIAIPITHFGLDFFLVFSYQPAFEETTNEIFKRNQKQLRIICYSILFSFKLQYFDKMT